VIAIISDFMEYDLLKDLAAGICPGDDAITNSDDRQRIISIFEVIAYITSIFAFLFWFYRVYKNLVLAEVADLKYSPGWAIGGFFIPVANLVIPYRVMAEVWKGSHVLSEGSPKDGWKEMKLSSRVDLWWALFIITNIVENIAIRLTLNADTIEGLTLSSLISIVSSVINIPAAIVTIYLVKDISKLQDDARVGHSRSENPADRT